MIPDEIENTIIDRFYPALEIILYSKFLNRRILYLNIRSAVVGFPGDKYDKYSLNIWFHK